MAVAAASALPTLLQAEVPTAFQSGINPRSPAMRYRKYELIGQGAQKKVYRAFDEERGIEVAWNEVAVGELPCFREKDQQRVFAEIRVLKQLKHKNIMSLHDYWFDERRLMLVFITEIFPDGTLRQYRRRHKHADISAIKRWAWQILQGLVYLHGHNPPIIHRDLKCDNIFVCGSSGVVKIGDLGLATLCRDFTVPQSVLGTPEFMAPELYEEKYDEKVDVYAFGMCLLELATMEYPYCECTNAAQIYKKVSKGIPPASVEKLTNSELHDFVILCLCHDPNRRPEARQLLKHSFFEAIRAAPLQMNFACGTPPKLTIVSSVSVSQSAVVSQPVVLIGSASSSAMADMATSIDDRTSSMDLNTSSLTHTDQCTIFSYDSGSTGTAGSSAATPTSPLLSIRSTSLEMPQLHSQLSLQLPSISSQPMCPIPIASSDFHGNDASIAAVVSAAVSMPTSPMVAGSIAAAGLDASYPPPIHGSGQVGVSLLSECSFGSVASSVSPAAKTGVLSFAFAAVTDNGGPPSLPIVLEAAATEVRVVVDSNILIPCQSERSMSDVNGAGCPAAARQPTATLSPQLPGSGYEGSGGSIAGPQRPSTLLGMSSLTAVGDANVLHRAVIGMAGGARMAEGRSQLTGGAYASVSPSAAAIAAAAVSAAAAAVGASTGPTTTSPLGLPAIHEDHELSEDVMFDQDDSARRETHYGADRDSDEEADQREDEEEVTASVGDLSSVAMGGCRSQPVSLKVQSSGRAAVNDMALSFAMSFTNQRGVRKKVGFQYDLLHDTASAIAVEMVENLSLNTAEAEAIAAMIQHEVSRYNQQQPQ